MLEAEKRESILVLKGVSLEMDVVREISEQIGNVNIEETFKVNLDGYRNFEASLVELSTLLKKPFQHGILALHSNDEHGLEAVRVSLIMSTTLPSLSLVAINGDWNRSAQKFIYNVGRVYPEYSNPKRP